MTRGPDPEELPVALRGAAFSVATASGFGVGRGRLRSVELERRVHGARAPIGAADDSLGRLRLLSARLTSEAVVSHASAAMLHGIPLPPRFRDPDVLEFTVPAPARAPHATGIRGHSMRLAPDDVTETAGFRLTTKTRTWVDLTPLLELEDHVAAGDWILRSGDEHALRAELSLQVERVAVRRRGRSRQQIAFGLLDARAESPQESRLRLMLMRGGLPIPDVNSSYVLSTGRTVRIDLSYAVERVAIEYQGDHHREQQQWRADLGRRADLEADGWYVLEVTAADLLDPARLVARVRAALERQRRILLR